MLGVADWLVVERRPVAPHDEQHGGASTGALSCDGHFDEDLF